ncbi:MAG: 50S ribosomal protein L10 [Elusimicrobiota bacterium]
MNKKEKEATLEELKTRLEKSSISLFAGFKGLSTPEIFEARKKMKAQKFVFKVIKKSLLKKAFDKIGIQAKTPDFWKDEIAALTGFSGDPLKATKLLAEWADQNKKVAIKGGFLLDKKEWLDKKAVEKLSKLPGVKELQGQLVGALSAPIAGLSGVLSAVLVEFLLVLRAVEDQKRSSAAQSP